MKKSIVRLIAFSVVPFLVICYSVYLINQKTDDFYKRFTSPQQNSLILGSSRAASMNPQILDSLVSKKFPGVKFYNYAFTWAHSPYGPKYLESIKKKILNDSKNGFFVVTVEPTALMVNSDTPDDPSFYIENDKSVAQTSQVSMNPNLEYLIENYNFSITNELNNKILPEKNKIAEANILENGKIDIKMLKSIPVQQRVEENKVKMKELQERIKNLKISDIRLGYLSETISFLQQHGKVILVRMPVNKTPYEIEKKAYPDFDQRMKDLSTKQKIHYINYNDFANDYECGDEVHLVPKSMDQFSRVLGNDILKKY